MKIIIIKIFQNDYQFETDSRNSSKHFQYIKANELVRKSVSVLQETYSVKIMAKLLVLEQKLNNFR